VPLFLVVCGREYEEEEEEVFVLVSGRKKEVIFFRVFQ
jgi:hypothetical protein